jgi:hypothetical protein
VLDKPVMLSSSDNDEIVSILALVTTKISTRETASEMGGSFVGNAQNRERSFALKMPSIREDYFIDDDAVRRDGGIGKKYSEEEFEMRLECPGASSMRYLSLFLGTTTSVRARMQPGNQELFRYRR